MRDLTKVIIGLGSIWGLCAFGFILMTSFTIGANDTAPEVVAIAFYGLTILPACLLAIWFRRAPAWWLIALSPISAYGMIYQGVHEHDRVADFVGPVLFALIPSAIGALLLWSRRAEPALPASTTESADREEE
jgi:hypothetical protein